MTNDSTTKHLRVSIITPCYNDARFISECIESVLGQDYPNVEHIIQDAASDDGTIKLLRHYKNISPSKIAYVSEPDKGQADGLNKAIQRATGDILLVLNADDALLPHAASWAVQQLTKYPDVAVVYGDVCIIDENSNVIEEFRAHPYDFEKLLCVELVPPAQAAFIRRSHFEKVGFYADETLDTCPDYEMWVRVGLKFPMKYIPGFVTRYRRHTREFDSKSERTVKRFIDSKKLVMDRVFDAPRTPDHIKSLRKRAYGGLSVWALVTEIGMRGKSLFSLYTILFFIRSVRHYPFTALFKNLQAHTTLFLKRIWIYSIIHLKRFLRKILRALLITVPRRMLLKISRRSGILDFQKTYLSITKKDLVTLTVREKWQKLLCECQMSQEKL